MPKFNLGWLKDKKGKKFAPKTFLSQILNNDGSLFQKRVESIENTLKDHDDKIVNNEVISNHETRISNAESAISNYGTRLSDTETTINKHGTRISNAETAISDHDTLINGFESRINEHEVQYAKTYFTLIDTVNGCEYIVEMQDGNLVSYGKCVGITILQLPDKNSQVVMFDATGLRVGVVCEDGTTREITNYTISDVHNMIVDISYTENGITYTTNFKTSMISVENALIDFEYTKNADGTYTLTAWKKTLNGVSSTEMVIPDSDKIIVEVA